MGPSYPIKRPTGQEDRNAIRVGWKAERDRTTMCKLSDRCRLPRFVALCVALSLLLGACLDQEPAEALPPLPVLDEAGMTSLFTESEQPLVVNVWASWCIPCRSEAPLLRDAHRQFGDTVRFVGLDVQDSQTEAAAFLAEFEIDFENYFDFGAAGRQTLGGIGVPITYFIAPGGDVVITHNGVIDERALVLGIDELLAR